MEARERRLIQLRARTAIDSIARDDFNCFRVRTIGKRKPLAIDPDSSSARSLKSAYLVTIRRCTTAKIIAVDTPNMSIPSTAASGPGRVHEGDISTSPKVA